MRRNSSADCTGEPPGELIASATPESPDSAKARSRALAWLPRDSAVRHCRGPMTPSRRNTATVGGGLRNRSIGVVSAGFGVNRLIERFGIERRLHTAGERKSLLDPFLPEDPADVARLSALQQDIHETFKEQVRHRRGGKIDAADETLFSGEVLTGRMALARGLIDGIGDLRSVIRARFGDNVRLVPIATERRRRWWLPRRQRFVERELWTPIADLIGWLEARALWARFGL